MSTRVFSDRELLLAAHEELGELREQVAALHLRIERVATIAGVDTALGSRRADPTERCGVLGILGHPCMRDRHHRGMHWFVP